MEGSWPEWIGAISALILIGTGPFIWLNKRISAQKDQIADLKAEVGKFAVYREEHQKADDLAHADFKNTADDILQELRMVRTENLEQHRRLEGKYEDSVRENNEGRRGLHVKIDSLTERVSDMNAKVERLSGRLESRDDNPDRRNAS